MAHMERVIRSPELLDIIFQHTDRKTDRYCATVNKDFFEAATKQLWHRVGSLYRIYSILGKISKNEKYYHFDRVPSLRDWDRFYLYSPKVRHLIIEEKSWAMNPIQREIARGRTQAHLFPRLSILDIRIGHFVAENIVLFTNRDLKELIVRTPFQSVVVTTFTLLWDTLARIEERADQLKKFSLIGNLESGLIEEKVAGFLQNQQHLRSVALPLYTLTSSMLSFLATLPKLEAIEFCHPKDSGGIWYKGKRSDVMRFKPELPNDAFPELKKLEVAATIQDLINFFTTRNAPVGIKSLHLRFLDEATPEAIAKIIKMIADMYKGLTELHLDFSSESTASSIETVRAIGFDALIPLFTLRNIIIFKIQHPWPLIFTEDNLLILALAWPSLKILSLNPEPFITKDMKPLQDCTLCCIPQCLGIFADYLENIISLKLYVHEEDPDIYFPHSGPMLEKLRGLSFGASFAGDTTAVATCISKFCPFAYVLINGIGWDDKLKEIMDPDVLKAREAQKANWDEVKRILVVVERVTRSERERNQYLEHRVQSLISKHFTEEES